MFKTIDNYIEWWRLKLFLMLMPLFLRILIIYMEIAEQQWLNYYLYKNEDYDTVLKRIRANKICPSSIIDLYKNFYKEYSTYYRVD